MEELCKAEPRPVKVTGPFTFTVEGIQGLGKHTSGGMVLQVKQSQTLVFKSLRQALAQPDFLM